MLILPETLRDRLLAGARAAAPAEVCGLLEGWHDGGTITVAAVHPAANVSPAPHDSFAIDPAFHIALQRQLRAKASTESQARDGGPAAVGVSEIIGCFHSHPGGRAEPSPRDRDNGCPDGFVWVIIATGVNEAIRAYQGPSFAPLTIRV